jgi:large subunit ribosomal protein L30
MAKKKVSKIRVKLVRSTIGRKPKHRATVKALGLGKVNTVVEKDGTPEILGMVNTVSYLVEVEEIK